MSSLTPLEKRQFEELFDMPGGGVIDFSNRTLAEFFNANGVDIYAEKYNQASGSKAHRLRAFWALESDARVGKVLGELIKHWEYVSTNKDNKAYPACQKTVERLLPAPKTKAETTESEFLTRNFGNISAAKLPIEPALIPILECRLKEAALCINHGAPLSVIFMCGSILEGALLGAAIQSPRKFNESNAAPKDKEGKVKQFQNWTLADFIDVACDARLISVDIKKFSHAMRDFRNYIHPHAQMMARFSPDEGTAKICLQVLKAAISELSGERVTA